MPSIASITFDDGDSRGPAWIGVRVEDTTSALPSAFSMTAIWRCSAVEPTQRRCVMR